MHRTLAFRSSFANEWRFDAHDNPAIPGARDLAEAIVQSLRSHVDAITPVKQHSYYGWTFDTELKSCRFANILNPVDVCYLTIRPHWYWLNTLLLYRPRQRLDEYCLILEQTLAAIPGVSSISW